MSKEQEKKAHYLIGRMVVENGIPFRVVESPSFLELMKLLKPAYKPPCRQTLSTKVTEDVYSGVEFEINRMLESNLEFYTLQLDFWSNIRYAIEKKVVVAFIYFIVI